jgi:uncharacterized membrane protein
MTVYTVTTLDDPSAPSPGFPGSTRAEGINNAGQIVGSFTVTTIDPTSLTNFGFFYDPNGGTFATIDSGLVFHGGLGGGIFAQGINDASQVVGYYGGFDNPTNPTVGTYGFLYSGGTFTALNDPLASPPATFAYGINNAGQIVGYYVPEA